MDQIAIRRAYGIMGGFGFVAGLPLPLSGFTLRYWMGDGGISVPVVGLTASVGISYSLKFLWAPALDRLAPPGRLAALGQRRGWLLVIQPLLVLACLCLALCDPSRPGTLIAVAAAVAFLSASQDITIDAWRIELFPERSQGVAVAAYVWGYRIALYVSGSLVIALSGPLGWRLTLIALATILAVGPILTLAAPSPAVIAVRRGSEGLWPSLQAAVVAPMAEMLSRGGAILPLAFVLLFKLGEAMAGTMAAPFYRSMGFDRVQISLATGIPALVATFTGIAVGGWLVTRLGVRRALVLTGFVQMASMTLYFLLAVSHGNAALLVVKVLGEGFAEAMADAAFLSFLSSLCAPGFTATQYALLSSLAALPLRTLASFSGFMADGLGWVGFYGLAIFAALPAMLVMLAINRRPNRVIVAVPSHGRD